MPDLDAPSAVADALLDQLVNRGIDLFIAAGTGTDFPPIIEAFVTRAEAGAPTPTAIVGIHEIPAVAMAHGYAMVSGRPAFVMLHTIVGSANGVMGVINAKRGRVPMLVASGRSAITESGHRTSRSHVVHWAQEAYDQQAMFREFVDWAYELRRPDQLPVAIDRAIAMATKAPPGPVHLMLPVEVLADPVAGRSPDPVLTAPAPAPAVPAPAALAAAVSDLANAQRPLVITGALGRDPKAVQALVALSEALHLPVVEHAPSYLSFPRNHPHHAGFDPGPHLASADVILIIECDVPWIPSRHQPADDAQIIVLDEDPLYRDLPFRGFPADLSLAGSPAETLASLLAHAAEHATRRPPVLGPFDWQDRARAQAHRAAAAVPIDPDWVSHCVAEQLGADDLLITEFVFEPQFAPDRPPGGYFDHAHSGGLGWSLGAALGAKAAAPERTVVCCVGDGTYTFGVPVATHHMAALHHLPVLIVIYNNAAWDRTRRAARGYSPEHFGTQGGDVPLSELAPTPAYEMVCQAAGGYGERVDDPHQLPDALARALRVVREEGRQALLNVITSKS